MGIILGVVLLLGVILIMFVSVGLIHDFGDWIEKDFGYNLTLTIVGLIIIGISMSILMSLGVLEGLYVVGLVVSLIVGFIGIGAIISGCMNDLKLWWKS